MKTIHHSSKGFTIIEVSLVLAIAGLIFVMIFVALPALQRQSRDAKRREDTLTLISAIKKYQQNNRGQLPEIEGNYYHDSNWEHSNSKPFSESNWGKFYLDYLGDNFTTPTNEKYKMAISTCKEERNGQCNDYATYRDFTLDDEGNWADWYIFTGATCQNNAPSKSSNSRNVAVIVKLESGEYCANT